MHSFTFQDLEEKSIPLSWNDKQDSIERHSSPYAYLGWWQVQCFKTPPVVSRGSQRPCPGSLLIWSCWFRALSGCSSSSLAGNHGLNLESSDHHPGCFTLSCKPPQCLLEVMDGRSHQNHSIWKNQRHWTNLAKSSNVYGTRYSPQFPPQNSLGDMVIGFLHVHKTHVDWMSKLTSTPWAVLQGWRAGLLFHDHEGLCIVSPEFKVRQSVGASSGSSKICHLSVVRGLCLPLILGGVVGTVASGTVY